MSGYALTEDQRFIQESARDYLAGQAGLEQLRAVIDGDAGWDAALWGGVSAEMGWTGLMVPEAHGGSGLGAVEMALVLEETGRVLAPVPFFETAVATVQAVLTAGSPEQQASLLPRLAAGELKGALAIAGPDGRLAPEGIAVELARSGAGFRLDGRADFVAFGQVADLLVVAARRPGSNGAEEISLVALPAASPGVHVEARPSLDLTRPYARISFEHVAVSPGQVLGAAEVAGPALERLLAVCSGLLAAEQTGATAFALESTVDYVKQRVQFGRPVGSFQAVKHALADMMLKLEAARSAALAAALAIDAGSGDLVEATSTARVYCSEALSHCAAQAIQLHGGIGFTWEHHAHLYFKRARSSSSLFGEPSRHREIVARAMGLDEAAVAPALAPAPSIPEPA